MKKRNIPILLYLIYIIYLLNIIGINRNIFTLLMFTIVLVYLIILAFRMITKTEIYVKELSSIEIIVTLIYILSSITNGINLKDFMLFFNLVLLKFYINRKNLSDEEYVRYVNYTYLLYLFLSILSYFNIIHITDILNTFDIKIFGTTIKTLTGLEGSTANIDIYSGTVFIINLLLNNRKDKFIYMVLSFLSLILTFRATPIVALIGVIIYSIVSANYLSKFYSRVVYILTVIFCYCSFYIPNINTFKSFDFAKLTHSRNLIWDQYIEIFRHEDIVDKLFGLRNSIPMASISWGNGYTYNPHSTYINMMYKYGIIISLILAFYLIIKTYKLSMKYKIVLMYILIGAITNGYLIFAGNPIFIITISFIINKSKYEVKDELT